MLEIVVLVVGLFWISGFCFYLVVFVVGVFGCMGWLYLLFGL